MHNKITNTRSNHKTQRLYRSCINPSSLINISSKQLCNPYAPIISDSFRTSEILNGTIYLIIILRCISYSHAIFFTKYSIYCVQFIKNHNFLRNK